RSRPVQRTSGSAFPHHGTPGALSVPAPNGQAPMTNVRSLCVLCFGLGAVSMLFVCTVVVPAKRELHARETTIAAQPSHFEAFHPHGTIEAVQIPLADPNGTFPDRDERLSK